MVASLNFEASIVVCASLLVSITAAFLTGIVIDDIRALANGQDGWMAVLLPKATAQALCHDDEMVVWSEDAAGALSGAGQLRDDLHCDEVVDLQARKTAEPRRVPESAFDHPEARTMLRDD